MIVSLEQYRLNARGTLDGKNVISIATEDLNKILDVVEHTIRWERSSDPADRDRLVAAVMALGTWVES